MEISKLYDSELKLMELIWVHEPISAKELSIIAANSIGWNKNTTYTILKKLVEKKIITRTEPNFICTSNIKMKDIQAIETRNLIKRLYNNSKQAFFSAFLKDEQLTQEELDELKSMIQDSIR